MQRSRMTYAHDPKHARTRQADAEPGRRPRWLQKILIHEGGLVILHMEPALLDGFNIKRITEQGREEWPDMSADEIAAWIDLNWSDTKPDDVDAVLGMLRRYEARQAAA